ncbi:hypothetical protein [Amycolatopsis sp. SB7-3]|uniref:hypothetical protein n=1 Tax=Amycolatopsis sp. SB7-3 TaxID=3373438 RepID=UPI00374375BE
MCTDLGTKAIVAEAWAPSTTPAPISISRDNLRDAVEDLGKPAVLVVEDLLNDGAFIYSLAEVFKEARVYEALNKGWAVFRHSGGERLELVAKSERDSFHHVVRIFALLDSDRWSPGQVTKSHKKARQLAADGIEVHVLELREAENYVPNSVLFLCGKHKIINRRVNALKKLTKEQRGYYDMKYGFGRPDEPARIRSEHGTLFSDTPAELIKALRGGFGTKILARFRERSPYLAPTEFERPNLDTADEIREILQKIATII